MIKFLLKGFGIVKRRLRDQGIRTTIIWVYARGIPFVTGSPLLKYSRVTPQLYVGPQYRSSGKRKLEQHDIHHGVNMRIEFDDAEHGLALKNYCHLPTIDDTAPTMEHLDQGIEFISHAMSDGGKVYIHCKAGVGRAATMAAAYLVSQGHTLDDAIKLIKKARPFITIMPPQMEQLRKLETKVRSR